MELFSASSYLSKSNKEDSWLFNEFSFFIILSAKTYLSYLWAALLISIKSIFCSKFSQILNLNSNLLYNSSSVRFLSDYFIFSIAQWLITKFLGKPKKSLKWNANLC